MWWWVLTRVQRAPGIYAFPIFYAIASSPSTATETLTTRTAFIREDAHTGTKSWNVDGTLAGKGRGAGLGLTDSIALDLGGRANAGCSHLSISIVTLYNFYQ